METGTGRRVGSRVGSPADIAVTGSRVALGALTAGFLLAGAAHVTVPIRVQLLVYLVGMVALNLPHGGYEHLANLRRRVDRFRLRYVAGYLLLLAGYLWLFTVAPVVGLLIAVAVACAKGGGGDLYALRATGGADHLQTRAQRLLAVAARGGPVMAVPIVAFPATFRTFSGIIVGLFEPGALATAGVPLETTRLLIGGGYAAVLLAHLGLGFHRRQGTGSWLVDAGETLLLVAYFATVPVVVAVGLYFPLWYSLRQVARELAVDPAGTDGWDLLAAETTAGTALRAWGLLVGGALSVGGVAATLWLLAPNPLGTAPLLYGAVAFWSVLISIIALPHVLIGSVLDRGRGIWHVP
ncbi:Brp/Blh family beta-carotene 15,15'-dioxygenase [Halosegnis sp.]|uniref:Brp/Blh family beta-carotene 15,15'-dioxygenase n=1 Tax=Halosegnis sp. TaxID=2864959 RepID=UPI0035D41A03